MDDEALESTEESPPEAEEFLEAEPVAVEDTSAVYAAFGDAYGPDAAAQLQSFWGDAGLPNERIVSALVTDNPAINQTYLEFQTESGGVTADGALAVGEILAKQSNFGSLQEMLTQHQEIGHLYADHFNESTDTLSAVGIFSILAYVGKLSGYSYTHHG